jgi:hypothetical protein
MINDQQALHDKIRHQLGAVTISKELSFKILNYDPYLWIVFEK